MALRVLLADESGTIKKVFQLTLQDFGVDVRAVSVGLDVLSVTKSFKPDIIFADVLLAKKSGYEVCHELKADPETAQIPVILMWSGFMEIDEQRARLSGADRRLEKPFDPSALRNLVQDLVKKTRDNPVSSYIQFPPLPEFQEPTPPAASPAAPQVKPEIPTPKLDVPSADDINLVIDDTEAEDEWVQKPPPASQVAPVTAKTSSQINIEVAEEFAEFPLTSAPQIEKLSQSVAHQVTLPGIDPEIMREEIQKWLAENMAPLAERIIRDEINRLLQDSEQTIQAP